MAGTEQSDPLETFRGFFYSDPSKAPLSYQALENRRKIAQILAARRQQPIQNIGQGIKSAADDISDALYNKNSDLQEQAYMKGLVGISAANPVPGAPTSSAIKPQAYAPDAAGPGRIAETEYSPDALAMQSPFGGTSGEPAPTLPNVPADVPLPPERPVFDRTRQIAELQDPVLRQRFATVVKGEGSDPLTMAETILNRSEARNTPVARELEMFTGRGSRGYYPQSTFGRGRVGEDVINAALRGTDTGGQTLGFSPTGNASGSVATSGVARGLYNAAGRLAGDTETFVQQERPSQLARLEAARLPPRDATEAIDAALTPRATAYAATDNPPIVTDIPPAPVRVAEAIKPKSSATVSPALTTSPSPGLISEPTAPTMNTQPTLEEIRGMNLLRQYPGDPNVAIIAKQLMEYGAAQRKSDYDQAKLQYEARRDVFKPEFENRFAREASERIRQLAIHMGVTNEEAAAISKDYIEKKRPVAQTIAEGQDAIRQARIALSSGAITGIGADARVNWSRLMSLLGRPNAGSDAANAQAFGILMQPVTNAQRAAAVGNTQISNADIQMSKLASGSDIHLEPKAIAHILNVLEENGLKHLKDYKTRVETLFDTENHPGRKGIYGAPDFDSMPQTFPAPPGGQPVQVWTEKDLQRYPPGTPVILPSGRRGVVQ